MTTARAHGWSLFDAIVATAPRRDENPWLAGNASAPGGETGLRERSAWIGGPIPSAHRAVEWADHEPGYRPDTLTLSRLLGVPVYLRASSQSGIPALALDVWVAYELRRAGFDPDAVWPRAQEPRVVPTEILTFIDKLPPKEAAALRHRIRALGTGGSSAANLLGKNYVKQVDVVMTSWATGPELMISTKRMDSSFGKNAANRVEESYGDAKNLRLRHPQAALGFVFALSARAFRTEPDIAAWIVDLLIKLGREDDAYDAVALVVPELTPEQEAPAGGGPRGGEGLDDDDEGRDQAGDDDGEPAGPLVAGNACPYRELTYRELTLLEDDASEDTLFGEVRPAPPNVSDIPLVSLRHDAVPVALDPARFLRIMCERVLDNSPVNFHREARRRRAGSTS